MSAQMTQTPITVELLTQMMKQMESRIQSNIQIQMNQMESRIYDNMQIQMNQMESRIYDNIGEQIQCLREDVKDIKQDISSLKSISDRHDMEIRYIKRNVELGTCQKKSFMKDGWKLSSMFVPAIQCVSAYVIAYTVSTDKKNN